MPREPAALTRLARLRTDLEPDREALEARFAEAAELRFRPFFRNATQAIASGERQLSVNSAPPRWSAKLPA